MTDFYTLLKQSILARRIYDPAQRRAVYAQARNALIRQLAGQEPKLTNADITERVIGFDRTMRKLEAELATEIRESGAEATTAASDQDVADDAYTEPEVEREASGWDVGDELAEDEDPLARDSDAPVRSARSGDIGVAPSLGAVARRRRRLLEDDELPSLPEPLPNREWTDEEAMLSESAEAPPAPPRRLPPPQRRLGWTLSDTDKVRVLVGAIGALALVLIGLLIYLFLPGRDTGVRLPINAGGSVSDAATASRIAAQALDVKQSFIVFDGLDPTIFQAASDNPVRLDSDAMGPFVRVGTSTASTGVKVQIGPGLASRLAGQNIRVVVTARASVERGALNMRFAYQSGIVLSHWQTANLSPAYGEFGMTWIVPLMRTSPNGSDYLLIEPGIPGDGTYADIRSIRVDLLGSPPIS